MRSKVALHLSIVLQALNSHSQFYGGHSTVLTQFGRYHFESVTGSNGNETIFATLKDRVYSFNPTTALKNSSYTPRIIGDSTWGPSVYDGSPPWATFDSPKGLDIFPNQNPSLLFIADQGGMVIRRINISTAEVTTVAGIAYYGNKDGPFGLGYYQDGALRWATFNAPFDLVVNRSSTSVELFVSDSAGNRIRRIRVAENEVTTVAGSGSFTKFSTSYGPVDGAFSLANFWSPRGLCYSALLQCLFVADHYHGRIRSINFSSNLVETLVGVGEPLGTTHKDGYAHVARIPMPLYITVDDTLYNEPNVFLYLTAGSRVRAITVQSGLVQTLAGNDSDNRFTPNAQLSEARYMKPRGLQYLPPNVDHDGLVLVDQGVGYLSWLQSTFTKVPTATMNPTRMPSSSPTSSPIITNTELHNSSSNDRRITISLSATSAVLVFIALLLCFLYWRKKKRDIQRLETKYGSKLLWEGYDFMFEKNDSNCLGKGHYGQTYKITMKRRGMRVTGTESSLAVIKIPQNAPSHTIEKHQVKRDTVTSGYIKMIDGYDSKGSFSDEKEYDGYWVDQSEKANAPIQKTSGGGERDQPQDNSYDNYISMGEENAAMMKYSNNGSCSGSIAENEYGKAIVSKVAVVETGPTSNQVGSSKVTSGIRKFDENLSRLIGDKEIEILALTQKDGTSHPNIVKLLGFSILEGNSHCPIIEFCDKGSLDKLRTTQNLQKPIVFRRIALDVCRGLAHLHFRNILHRDIGTRNLFMKHDGTVVIGDFGLARRFDHVGKRSGYTVNNFIGISTVDNDPCAYVTDVFTKYTDLWGLGMALWEIASNQRPQECINMNAYRRQLKENDTKLRATEKNRRICENKLRDFASSIFLRKMVSMIAYIN